MAETFASLSAKLSRAGVKFLIVGGAAVFLNGYPRATFDLDLLVEHSPENLRKLLEVLAHFGEGYARELTVADFDLEEGAVRIAENFEVDVFTVMRGHTYADFLPRSRSADCEDAAIRFLGAEDLIELKRASPREKDQHDVAMLRRIISGDAAPEPADLALLTPPADPMPSSSE